MKLTLASNRRSGFTLAEIMISLVVLLIVMGSIKMGFYILLRKMVVNRAVYNVEVEQESASTIITGLCKNAAAVSLYSDPDTYVLNGASAVQTSGNYAVLTAADGSAIAAVQYEVETGNIILYRGGTGVDGTNGVILAYAVNPLTRPGFPDHIFRLTDGLMQANWTINGRFERYDVHCLGVPTRMR